MKIDIDKFDKKGRYYQFYFSVGWSGFYFGVTIADYGVTLALNFDHFHTPLFPSENPDTKIHLELSK